MCKLFSILFIYLGQMKVMVSLVIFEGLQFLFT